MKSDHKIYAVVETSGNLATDCSIIKLWYASLDKKDAHKWAENKFGCAQDGICVDNIHVISYSITLAVVDCV